MSQNYCDTAAVPNLSGTRDWFRRRQFSSGPGGRVVGGGGSGGNASHGEQQQMKLRSPAALPQLTSCCAARFLIGHGPVPVHGPGVGDPCDTEVSEENKSTNSLSFIYIDVKYINKVSENCLGNIYKGLYNMFQWDLSQERQGWLNIWISINGINHVNKIKGNKKKNPHSHTMIITINEENWNRESRNTSTLI